MTNAIKLLMQIQISFLQLESTLSTDFYSKVNNNLKKNAEKLFISFGSLCFLQVKCNLLKLFILFLSKAVLVQ
jgi:hypothetical protein